MPDADTAAPPPPAIDLEATFDSFGVGPLLEGLDRESVGLLPVKRRMREVAALLLVDKLRRDLGLSAEQPTLRMSFTGNPGTGETTVAARVADILHRLGYIRSPHLVSVTRDGLVVILAGYADRMGRFFASNPGFRSRVAHHIDFPDYDAREPMAIAELMLAGQRYRFSPAAREAFARHLEARMRQPHFANARPVRNALDRTRLRQAVRLFERRGQGAITAEDLMTIGPEEILSSRVLADPPATPERAA
jgi:AAA lid domain